MRKCLNLLVWSVILCFYFQNLILAQQKDEEGFEIFMMEDEGKMLTMKKYYLVFLKAGDKRDQPKAEAQEIQAGHLANIKKLATEKKLCLAGPVESETDLAGIFILNVKSKEEAEALVAEDPAVKAGRLKAEIVPWWGAKGGTLF